MWPPTCLGDELGIVEVHGLLPGIYIDIDISEKRI